MKTILMSGGSGKRLWPLSNHTRAKQFLKLLQSPTGEMESMLQRVWRQISEIGIVESTYIATGKSQEDIIRNQLGYEIPLIIEPQRKDTFPAIALACVYLYSVEGVSEDVVVSIVPIDMYVETPFFNKVIEIEAVLNETDTDLVLIGVKPTYPSTKYGYIIPQREKSEASPYLKVNHFKEKPNEEEAQILLQDKALWNCGVFGFKLSFILKMLEERGIPLDYTILRHNYSALDTNSFDYEVVEQTNNIVTLEYKGDWKDLGTWNTLTEELNDHLIGKGRIGSDCYNVHVLNHLDIPIVTMGLTDSIVSASPDGILVTTKAASPRLKELLQDGIEIKRPMFEERRWGWYRVLEYSKEESGNEVLTKRLCIYKGRNLSYQFHEKRSEVWTIVAGEGEFILNGSLAKVAAGHVLKIPARAKHAILAHSDLHIIEVQMGTELIEEDIIRVDMIWTDIVQHVIQNKVHLGV